MTMLMASDLRLRLETTHMLARQCVGRLGAISRAGDAISMAERWPWHSLQ